MEKVPKATLTKRLTHIGSHLKHSIIFAGSSQFSADVLDFICKQSNITIKKVITLPEKPFGRGKKLKANPVHLLAIEKSLPLVLTKSLKKPDIKDRIIVTDCDFLLVVAFGLMIPQWLLDHPKHEPLNIHASLLPKWRGASPIHKALENGDLETGICLMRMTLGLDEGPVFIKQEVPIFSQDLFKDLEQRLLKCSFEILLKYFSDPFSNSPKPQVGDSSYAEKLVKEDGLIKSTSSAITVFNKFRAFHLWPGLYFIDKESKLTIKVKDLTLAQSSDEQLKKVLTVKKNVLLLKLKGGIIEIKTIQFPGKKPISISQVSHDKKHAVYQLNIE